MGNCRFVNDPWFIQTYGTNDPAAVGRGGLLLQLRCDDETEIGDNGSHSICKQQKLTVGLFPPYLRSLTFATLQCAPKGMQIFYRHTEYIHGEIWAATAAAVIWRSK